MALYNFQKRFVPMILSGEKRHTIRAKRARATRPGEMLHLYTGLRQKGAQLLMRTVCTMVDVITIGIDGVVWIESLDLFHYIHRYKLETDERERLAVADGFSNFAEMMDFWKGRLPFRGEIIHWKFPPTSHTTVQEKRKCANAKGQLARSSSRDLTASAQPNAGRATQMRSAGSSGKIFARGRKGAQPAASR